MNAKAVVLAMALFFGVAQANDINVDKNGVVVPPVCRTLNGKIVRHVIVSQEFLNRYNGSLAMAMHHFPTKINQTAFDYKSFQNFAPEFQLWVLAHECAHHQLGHTLFANNDETRRQSNKIEMEADCHAAELLKDLTDEQWDSVFAEMKNEKKIQAAAITGPFTPDVIKTLYPGYHNNHKQRAEHVKQCLSK